MCVCVCARACVCICVRLIKILQSKKVKYFMDKTICNKYQMLISSVRIHKIFHATQVSQMSVSNEMNGLTWVEWEKKLL